MSKSAASRYKSYGKSAIGRGDFKNAFYFYNRLIGSGNISSDIVDGFVESAVNGNNAQNIKKCEIELKKIIAKYSEIIRGKRFNLFAIIDGNSINYSVFIRSRLLYFFILSKRERYAEELLKEIGLKIDDNIFLKKMYAFILIKAGENSKALKVMDDERIKQKDKTLFARLYYEIYKNNLDFEKGGIELINNLENFSYDSLAVKDTETEFVKMFDDISDFTKKTAILSNLIKKFKQNDEDGLRQIISHLFFKIEDYKQAFEYLKKQQKINSVQILNFAKDLYADKNYSLAVKYFSLVEYKIGQNDLSFCDEYIESLLKIEDYKRAEEYLKKNKNITKNYRDLKLAEIYQFYDYNPDKFILSYRRMINNNTDIGIKSGLYLYQYYSSINEKNETKLIKNGITGVLLKRRPQLYQKFLYLQYLHFIISKNKKSAISLEKKIFGGNRVSDYENDILEIKFDMEIMEKDSIFMSIYQQYLSFKLNKFLKIDSFDYINKITDNKKINLLQKMKYYYLKGNSLKELDGMMNIILASKNAIVDNSAILYDYSKFLLGKKEGQNTIKAQKILMLLLTKAKDSFEYENVRILLKKVRSKIRNQF